MDPGHLAIDPQVDVLLITLTKSFSSLVNITRRRRRRSKRNSDHLESRRSLVSPRQTSLATFAMQQQQKQLVSETDSSPDLLNLEQLVELNDEISHLTDENSTIVELVTIAVRSMMNLKKKEERFKHYKGKFGITDSTIRKMKNLPSVSNSPQPASSLSSSSSSSTTQLVNDFTPKSSRASCNIKRPKAKVISSRKRLPVRPSPSPSIINSASPSEKGCDKILFENSNLLILKGGLWSLLLLFFLVFNFIFLLINTVLFIPSFGSFMSNNLQLIRSGHF